jgi:hypothetical protein
MAEPSEQGPGTAVTPVTGDASSRVRRLLLAAGVLAEPSRTLFDRMFLRGEKAAVVRSSLGLSEQEFGMQHTNMLRALMSATQ